MFTDLFDVEMAVVLDVHQFVQRSNGGLSFVYRLYIFCMLSGLYVRIWIFRSKRLVRTNTYFAR